MGGPVSHSWKAPKCWVRGESSKMITETWKSRLQDEQGNQVSVLKQSLIPEASRIEWASFCIESRSMITETLKSYCNGGLQDEQGDQVAHLKK